MKFKLWLLESNSQPEANIFLTDKSGKRFFNTTCTYGFHQGEQRNLEHRLQMAKNGQIKSIDPATVRMVILVDGKEININQDDLDLLRDLES